MKGVESSESNECFLNVTRSLSTLGRFRAGKLHTFGDRYEIRKNSNITTTSGEHGKQRKLGAI